MKSLKKNILFIILFISTNTLLSQNLIYNGSFEIRKTINGSYGKINCPYSSGHNYGYNYPSHLTIADGWYDAHDYSVFEMHTFDYFHKCCNTSYNNISYINCSVGAPKHSSRRGFQYPRTGNGFIGGALYAYNRPIHFPDYGKINSEYIQSKLINKLEKDTLYKFEFYVNRNNSFQLASKSIGAHFSKDKIEMQYFILKIIDSTLIPQVINKNGFITDTLNWVKIEGVFKAQGDEEYITLGNFDLREWQGLVVDPNAHYYGAYYYFDDLALYKVSTKANKAECGNDTLICKGESLVLGKTKVEDEYREEYKFEWFVLGKEDSIFSLKQNPIVNPDTTTIFVLKLTDFKFDVSYDTIMVNVVECKIPTSFKVYPVPTSDIVNFEFNYPISRDMQIDLFDVNGKLINKYNMPQNFESKIVTIDLRILASGVYIYQISFENKKTFYGKLVFVK